MLTYVRKFRKETSRPSHSMKMQMFFNRTQKQGLPLLNPNAKSFKPDDLIKKRDKLHEQRIKLRDQHSVIIEDLAPGQEVLTQDYISGLWKDSAVVLSKRDDGRSYWVRDNQGRSFIGGRRRLKAVSQSADNPQETATNQIEISVSRVNMAWQLNDRTLKAKLHRLPQSVVRSALHQPLVIQQQHLQDNTSICVFYLPDRFQPQSRFHSTDFYNLDHPKGLKPRLKHYIISSDSILSSSGSNGINPGPALPQRSLWRQDQVLSSGIPTVSSRKEYSRSELSGGVQGSHNAHREFRVSLHRNPSGDSRGNVDLNNRFWSTPVLSEVSQVPVPQATATPEPARAFPQGISKPGRECGDAGYGRNLPTAPGSGIWCLPYPELHGGRYPTAILS